MSLPGADELFRTTGGMALSPSLASRSAAEAPRPETARAVNGTVDADGAEGAEGVGGADTGRWSGRSGPSSRAPRCWCCTAARNTISPG
ncbi:hypothetical protein ACWC5I_33240, partial [Kitasatospora sp. NPDC001574]